MFMSMCTASRAQQEKAAVSVSSFHVAVDRWMWTRMDWIDWNDWEHVLLIVCCAWRILAIVLHSNHWNSSLLTRSFEGENDRCRHESIQDRTARACVQLDEPLTSRCIVWNPLDRVGWELDQGYIQTMRLPWMAHDVHYRSIKFVVMNTILPSAEITPSRAFSKPLSVSGFIPW